MLDGKAPAASTHAVPAALLAVITLGVAVLVANLYYAQPLIASIAAELSISNSLAGSIVSVAQIGYGTGLFFIVPAADLIENKRLVITLMALTVLALVALATSSNALTFLGASFLLGLCATGAQVLLPFAAHLIPEHRRGQLVGNIMAGVLTGIMLARPFALFISGSFGWRAVFWTSACLVSAIALLLMRLMPPHRPASMGMNYCRIIVSMLGLAPRMPALCWRSAYAALMFGAFNLFWTAVPLMLARHFGLGQHAIGLFALAGAGGALAAPIAGRLADRGLEITATAGSMVVLALCFAATGWAVTALAMLPLIAATVLLDAAVQTNQVVSRRTVFGTAAAIRGRVNALYMTATFIGGAAGSLLGTLTFSQGGWSTTAAAGAALGIAGLGLLAIEMRADAPAKLR